MTTSTTYSGYSEAFISPELVVPMPVLSGEQQADLAPVAGTTDNIADYGNYSAAISKSRGFIYFAASNIEGTLFKKASRPDNWRKDDRIAAEFQWGDELYKAPKSDFDKGHMVKREDVQWGKTILEARKAADSTFFYPNAVPQHGDLNQKIWAELENYILHTEAVQNNLRVAVFTGPVLRNTDPVFVSEVNNQEVQLPTLFWKVVVYTKGDGKLYRVGFLMGQLTLLEKNKIIKPVEKVKAAIDSDLFMEFEDAETYQVNIATIQTLTKLTLPAAMDAYQDDRPIKLILEEVEIIPEKIEKGVFVAELGFRIPDIVL